MRTQAFFRPSLRQETFPAEPDCALVGDYLVAAMHIDNFLNYIEKDQLIITPGDRTDILLASIASRLSSATPDIAGVLLTGGLEPPASVRKLIEGWSGAPLPILLTKAHTYRTITALMHCITDVGEPAVLHNLYLLCFNGFTCVAIVIGMVIGANLPIYLLKHISFQATR